MAPLLLRRPEASSAYDARRTARGRVLLRAPRHPGSSSSGWRAAAAQLRSTRSSSSSSSSSSPGAAADVLDTQPSTSGRDAPASEQPWQAAVLELLRDAPGQLVRITLRGRIGDGMPYKQAVVRPVMLKGKSHLQFTHLTLKQDLTKNLEPDDALRYLEQLLQLPWHSAAASTLQAELRVQVGKRGRVLVQRSSAQDGAAAAAGPLLLAHDRAKALPIDGSRPDAFLQKIGLQTADGRIKANMQAKFRQINDFLKLLIHTGELEHLLPQQQDPQQQQQQQQQQLQAPAAIRILDCGCGSAHLTFGTYHYLRQVRGWRVALTGVDANGALMERSNRLCRELGLAEDVAAFHASPIRAYVPDQPPHLVLALHACDTATDEALALGVRAGAPLIAAAPCCHQHLHRQLQGWPGGGGDPGAALPLRPLLGDGILRQRFVDLLTDTLRAMLLRICGYRRLNQTFTIEPIFLEGKHGSRMWADEWTAVTVDGGLAAQYEHTVLITAQGAEVLTVA